MNFENTSPGIRRSPVDNYFFIKQTPDTIFSIFWADIGRCPEY
jgi:hypothetical protein